MRDSLSFLEKGEKGRIVDIGGEREIVKRLFDMGVAKGKQIECVNVSPLGNPKAFLIGGAVIAVRNGDAELISVLRGE